MRILAPLLIGALWPASLAAEEPPRRVDFAREVRPILEHSCWKCHGPEKQKGGLRLDLQAGALGAGDSGSRAIMPGKAEDSELIRRIESDDAEERMPPKSAPLGHDKTQILKTWISQGAAWPEAAAATATATATATADVRRAMTVTDEDRRHWSYLPLGSVAPPRVREGGWGRTPVDRFILAALEARGIRPNPRADRRTLIRRVYFDLIGLPPSPEDVKAFVADPADDAYERLVDRLLASRHHGERWGRHWLDVARYADSDGLETDADRPTAYHYRDFVIESLNADLPYRTFVRWQIAGDEYVPDDPAALAATGFLAAAPNEVLDVPMVEEKLRLRYNELDDMAVTTTTAFLGLTLGCARCHDHKYDAIPTRDYYRLQCAFTTTGRKQVLLATRAEAARYHEQESRWKKRLKAAQNSLDVWLAEQKQAHTARLRTARIDSLAIDAREKALLKEQPESEAGKKLARRHEKSLAISDDEYRQAFSPSQRQRWDTLRGELESVRRSKPRTPLTALAVVDTQATPEPTWLLARGDMYAKTDQLQVGFLSVLTGSKTPEDYWTAARREVGLNRSTGQRRALADWITDVDQGAGPLLARVMVNRVWQHHFGEGLVRTVSDFGVRGERPSHPELLEWLAHEFVAGGWRLKPLHRLILTSAVYTQTTNHDAVRAAKDPDDRLLWRRRPMRLEAEVLRDSVLSVSGMLNLKPLGPAFKPPIPPEAMQARNTKDPYPRDAQDLDSTRRRSVYMFHKRVVQHPLLQAFDGPDAVLSCGRRSTTTVAPQALALLNDPFLRARAADLARRLLIEGGSTPDGWVTRGFELAISRTPSDAEHAAGVRFLERQLRDRSEREPSVAADTHRLRALADFAQVLFSLNEFIYVD